MVGPDDVVGNMEKVDGADAGGQCDERLLRGDERVVQARRELAVDGSRRRAAVKAPTFCERGSALPAGSSVIVTDS